MAAGRSTSAATAGPSSAASRPLLLVDVDGVLLPFPERRPGFDGVAIEGAPHGFCARHGAWLRELAADFDLAWCTMWGARANQDICPRLQLPALPIVDLWDPACGLDRWKLPGVERFAGDRPLAWVDDAFDAPARAWGRRRRAPTLLLGVRPLSGLARHHVRRLRSFAREVRGAA